MLACLYVGIQNAYLYLFCKYSIRKTFFTNRMLPIWNCFQNTTVYEYLQKFCKPVK